MFHAETQRDPFSPAWKAPTDLTQSREYGDIRENAEYDMAKRDQSVIEGRIHELEALLASVEIIELPEVVETAEVGVRVCFENLESCLESDYLLVSEQEAHLGDDRLSVESPLGRALLGSREGDVVTFDTPGGVRRVKVVRLYAEDGEED